MKTITALACYEVGGQVTLSVPSNATKKQIEELVLEKLSNEGEAAITKTCHRDYQFLGLDK